MFQNLYESQLVASIFFILPSENLSVLKYVFESRLFPLCIDFLVNPSDGVANYAAIHNIGKGT